jgi:uncharacterized protein DUF3226
VADKLVLLVEGKDDEHVFYALLNYHAIPRSYRIKDKQGISNLLSTLEVELLASDLERLGIIIDADVDIAARWQSLRDILRNSGYTHIPSLPQTGGTLITEEGHPVVGIWIMPDNSVPGMLEHFVQFLVPPGDNLWDKSIRCIDGIPNSDRLFPTQHLIKAQLHTWLAWQEEPGSPIGLAIVKRYLDANAIHAQRLVAWVRRLFDLAP